MAGDALLIAVLQSEWSFGVFSDKCDAIGIVIEFPHRDLLDAILNEIGVPEDKTTKVDYKQIPDVFCRDWAYAFFYTIITEGTEAECAQYLATIRRDVEEMKMGMN